MSLPDRVKIWLASSTLPPQILSQSDPPPVELSVGDIQWQIVAEWLEVEPWSQWRAYIRNHHRCVRDGAEMTCAGRYMYRGLQERCRLSLHYFMPNSAGGVRSVTAMVQWRNILAPLNAHISPDVWRPWFTLSVHM